MVRLFLFLFLMAGSWSAAQEVFDPLDPTDDDDAVGIEVGEKIPAFRAVDQNGKSWTFDDLKGSNGAVILFHRSADW